jgi:hypothetical protein
MILYAEQLRDVDIIDEPKEVTVVLTECNGSYYGGKTEIKMPARDYEMLEEAVIEKWLAKKNAT